MRRLKPDSRCSLLALAVLLAGSLPVCSTAQEQGQQTFSSPQAAIDALVKAVRANDEGAMLRVLGHDARRIVSSGDPVEDANSRASFVQRYQQMHRLVGEPDGTTALYIGAENWPMPIPLAHAGPSWYFDTDAAKRDILYRRIGRNELSAIRVCEELAAAEKEFHSTHGTYAARILSDPGQQNGLYWEASAGKPQSPIGPLVAAAVAEGYSKHRSGAPTPFRGYHFHVLVRQGAAAPGGARNYMVNGRMTGGFAYLAYPAKYRTSGVMTFIVSNDGVVYQKDLGRETARIARAMETFDPDASWKRADAGN